MLEMEKAVQQLATAERALEIRIGLLGCALLYVYVKNRMDRGWSDRVTNRNILWKVLGNHSEAITLKLVNSPGS